MKVLIAEDNSTALNYLTAVVQKQGYAWVAAHDGVEALELFQQEYVRAHKDKHSSHIVQRANEYWAMLEPRGDGDFSEVARHLCSFSTQDPGQAKSINLKLVLHIRKIYKLVFDRLI